MPSFMKNVHTISILFHYDVVGSIKAVKHFRQSLKTIGEIMTKF